RPTGNQRLHGTDAAGLLQPFRRDLGRLLPECHDAGLIQLEHLRRNVDAVPAPDAHLPQDSHGHAAKRPLHNLRHSPPPSLSHPHTRTLSHSHTLTLPHFHTSTP